MKISILVLCLVLAAVTAICMGQTFQYSHGWEAGKRAATKDGSFPETFELQAVERKLVRCLLQLQQYMRRMLSLHIQHVDDVEDSDFARPQLN